MTIESTARILDRGVTLSCVILVTLLSGPAVRAESNDRAQASMHFDRGLELIEENAYEAAAVEFERAYELSHDDTVLYDLGMAYVAAGRPVEAAAALSRYLDTARGPLPAAETQRLKHELQRQRARIGNLAVEIEPNGALIKVDGREVGRAPLSSPIPLASGNHILEIAHSGYEGTARTISIAGQENLTLRVALERTDTGLPAQLRIKCAIPDVKVLIDERVAAQTVGGAPLLTTAGDHVIRFQRAGYADTVRSVVLGVGVAESVDCGLRVRSPLPDELAAKIVVAVGKVNADVSLDGEPLPRPAQRRVPIGRHRLQITARGYDPWTGDVTLMAGESRVVPVELVRTRRPHDRDGNGAPPQRTLAYVLGGAGITVGIAALVTFLVANDRYSSWQSDKLAFDAMPYSKVEAERINDELKSVWQLDDIAIGLAITGGALLATGAVLLLEAGKGRPNAVSARLAVQGTSLQFAARF
jgi:hypothetical protein